MRKQFVSVLLVSTLLGIGLGAGVVAARPHPTQPPPAKGLHIITSQKGRLGMVVLTISPALRAHLGVPEDRGVLVDAVRPDSPASRAGLQVGDVVTDVAGATTTSARDVLDALSERKKGDDIAITLLRDGKRVELKAKLENDPEETADRLDGWFRFDGDPDAMRRSFEEMEKHMLELQRQFGPGAAHSRKI